MTERRPLDFYPTPPPVSVVVRRWLECRQDIQDLPWLDPAAGEGDLIRVVRDCEAFGSKSWHVVANPPFGLLDVFWGKIVSIPGICAAVLTPVAWWNAEKRINHRRPDHIIALGWRPVFHPKAGAAHKGSQDFCWSIILPEPQAVTTWERVEKPKGIPSFLKGTP